MRQIHRIGSFGVWAASLLCIDAFAGVLAPPPATAVPTLGEWGLAGIAALLAVAAGRALYKRKR
jgi:hypothetical protein